ncbi:MAG: methyltransferase MtaB domain-containing protein, partial [Candidatus Methanomethylophilaceae archaeon]|nr:methyltransferase MtaB domain-containing protein [Candidatus Methanomethylophilaceae archaeon]
IGKAIAAEGNNIYLRAKAAGLTAAKIIKRSNDAKELQLTAKQLDVVNNIIKQFEALPSEEDKFFEYCVKQYKDVPNFTLKNYGL